MVALGLALAFALTTSTVAQAQNAEPETPVLRARHHRVRRDRWRNTLSFGFSSGLGSPIGVAGAFLEYRPIRWTSASVGAGFGGAFGPSVAGSIYVDPIVTRVFALGVGGSFSHAFSWRSGEIVPGRAPLPPSTNWVSVEIEAQLRPTRGLFMRIGVGRAFLIDTQAFAIGTTQELDAANLPHLPFVTPVDAMYSAARHEDLGVWYVHFDIAPVWRL